MKFESVIGLEVHVQLATKSKIFCACPTVFGSEPNRNTCPVCLGWPGSLPVLNQEALRLAVKVGFALNCRIAEQLKFDRKNYFYPDLPKAYQISQFDMPVNGAGWMMIETRNEAGGWDPKRIGIVRAHLEEDAGKLLHEGIAGASHIDYNRAGVPLLEIVSAPDLRSAEEAYDYLVSLKAILQYLEVSDCNMEEGSLRCDANISVRPQGVSVLGTKVEVKNLNSFRAVEKAIEYEIQRQINCLENREAIRQETRLWSEARGQTFPMRSKEEAHDYRYFPEPDLVPFSVPPAVLEEIKAGLPELPSQRTVRFKSEYGLNEYDAVALVREKKLADYFETCVKEKADPKLASNWIQTELAALLNSRRLAIEESPVDAKALAELIGLVAGGMINGKIAKEVLPAMFETGKSAAEIVREKGLVQVTDRFLIEKIAEEVILTHRKSAEDFRAGKQQALGFLVGQIMKATQGKANPQLANEILRQKLKT